MQKLKLSVDVSGSGRTTATSHTGASAPIARQAMAERELMSNALWTKALAERFLSATGAPRNLRFPDERGMRMTGTAEVVTLTLSARAVCANMQVAPAAFEAWALVLHLWCRVSRVQLDWEIPHLERAPDRRHYERFLYRVGRFAELFPDWFEVLPKERLADSRALLGSNLLLNVAGHDDGETVPKTGSEAALERVLAHDGILNRHYGLTRLERQFPVGVFEGNVSRATQIFSGGKSAIDLIGIDALHRLWLFELKAVGGISAGIISELLFYAFVMRDILDGRIELPPRFGRRLALAPEELRGCSRIEACFLAPDFHPLLDGQSIVAGLNEALSRHRIPVHFRKVSLTLADGTPAGIAEVA